MDLKKRRNIVCKDPARQTAWNLKVNNPIDSEQFFIIDLIIHSLRNAPNNYLVIDINPEPLSCEPLTYIQAIRNGESLWEVELHFEVPCFFCYAYKGAVRVRKHPWTQFGAKFYNVKDVSAIFKQVLCHNSVPDLSKWRDYTKRIYLEQRKKGDRNRTYSNRHRHL